MGRNIMIKQNNDFSMILENYFTKHLSLERKFSTSTYNTYLIVIRQYLRYLSDIKDIRPKDISIYNFDKQTILNFLEYVETDLNCSIKTRNHKLTIINSFLEYAQSINPIYLDVYLKSKSIKLKKIKQEKMDFLTREELEVFMKTINIKTKNGYKHYVLIALLYEAGLRASELINLKTSDLFFTNESPYIKVLGKGNKERIIYLNVDIVSIVNEYIEKFKIKEGYLFLNHSKEQFTRFGINKIVNKYFELAKKECPTLVNKTITPHSFRHSKAVHLLMNNTALPIIQRFLGHNSIKTTEIYLDITNDEVSKSILSVSSAINTKENTEATWEGDEKLIELLESLK